MVSDPPPSCAAQDEDPVDFFVRTQAEIACARIAACVADYERALKRIKEMASSSDADVLVPEESSLIDEPTGSLRAGGTTAPGGAGTASIAASATGFSEGTAAKAASGAPPKAASSGEGSGGAWGDLDMLPTQGAERATMTVGAGNSRPCFTAPLTLPPSLPGSLRHPQAERRHCIMSRISSNDSGTFTNSKAARRARRGNGQR